MNTTLAIPASSGADAEVRIYTVQASRLSVAKCQNFPIDLRCQALVSL